jgi:hypothetical protein
MDRKHGHGVLEPPLTDMIRWISSISLHTRAPTFVHFLCQSLPCSARSDAAVRGAAADVGNRIIGTSTTRHIVA